MTSYIRHYDTSQCISNTSHGCGDEGNADIANCPKTMLVLKKQRKKPRSSGRHVSPIQSGDMVNMMPMAIPRFQSDEGRLLKSFRPPFTPLPARCVRQSVANCCRSTPATDIMFATRIPGLRPYLSSEGTTMKVAAISHAGAIELQADRYSAGMT